jgi:Cu+-exporting ATPase
MAEASIGFRPRPAGPGLPAGPGALTRLEVEGMDCASCAQNVTKALTQVAGVASAQVELAAARASVRWNPATRPQPELLVAAVKQAGYRARLEPMPEAAASLELSVTGMTCEYCARHVRQALAGVPGVASATVDLARGRAAVRLATPGLELTPALISAAKAAGYDAAPVTVQQAKAGGASPESGWRTALWLGGPVALALLLAEWIFSLGLNRTYHWAAFILALPVQVIVGGKFYRGAWRQLRVGKSNMDTLVALGSTAAFGFSAWALFTGFAGHLYFMEAVAILTLISAGHWLEARMSAKAGASLKSLLNLAPQTARKISRGAGEQGRKGAGSGSALSDPSHSSPLSASAETEVPVAQLTPGDLIALRPGDRVPVDAEVVEGASAVDEAMLTGEPVPVEKSVGAKLFAGTVNQSGQLVARVTATGEATALAHIIAAVERAQSSRADIQRLADKVSSMFVPIVVAIAVITAIWWGVAFDSAKALHATLGTWLWHAHVPDSPVAAAFVMFAAVLIVACPCAMGLATPAALMAGVNAAARRGILIRDAQALEKSGRINAVVFDKTGTLTEGRPAVVAAEDFRPADERSVPLNELAAALARRSQHPLSRTLAGLSPGELALGDWRERRGAGVEARWNNRTLRVGSVAWFRDDGVDLSRVQPFLDAWHGKGATISLMVADREVWGAFALRDELKPHAVAVLKQLRDSGHQLFLITGDNRHTGAVIAGLAGIAPENVFAEVHPEQKAGHLRDLQARGLRVAFVGDGLNDGPALAQADLGIAVTQATDVAKEAADILLLKSDLAAIPEALGLARATLRVIRQNLFWAFFYNAAFVPLAALGFLSPVLSAVAMGLSDLMVIGNALRLGRR